MPYKVPRIPPMDYSVLDTKAFVREKDNINRLQPLGMIIG